MALGPEHYIARASELEALAIRCSDSNIRAGYLKIARGFREMANLASLLHSSKDGEIAGLAERMVGKTSEPH